MSESSELVVTHCRFCGHESHHSPCWLCEIERRKVARTAVLFGLITVVVYLIARAVR